MRTAAIIVAAGRGLRAGGGTPKQFRALAGRPVLAWSLSAVRRSPLVEQTVLVLEDPDAQRPRLAPWLENARLARGGATRLQSVQAGFDALDDGIEAVLVHDAARPGLAPDDIERLIDALDRFDAVAPALAVHDALKRVDETDAVLEAPSREGLVRVQTPQAVRRASFGPALSRADPAVAVDELAVAAQAGLRVGVIAGAARLQKITLEEDFAILERLLTPNLEPATGSGFDAHRFGPGDHVTLCGVRIPHTAGLLGHSDADVGWHALTDAILGALSAGDIGDHFPPTDPRWRGADSAVFLAHARDLARSAGARLTRVDVTLICERPRIKPHREAMRARTAETLELPLARVSVKATTTEEMGFTGRSEGIAALASATLLVPPPAHAD